MKFSIVSLTALFALSLNFNVHAKPVSLDKVAVIVDQGVILESEITQLVDNVKKGALEQKQTLPSDRALRTQAIERLIVKNLQMQLASRMGIQISDPQLEQTIENIAAQQKLTLSQLREILKLEGKTYDAYREEVRTELITNEVRRANVQRRVYVTPQEISNLVKLIEEQGNQQAEFKLGHILIGFPPQPTDEDIADAKSRAEKVLELLNKGSEFERIAIASSSGSKALEGGDLGWLNINSMPTLFAEAVQGKEKDTLIGPIRSGAGFHILKIHDLRGVEKVEVAEINARHILVTPTVILSEEKAEKMLNEFKEKILAGELDFAELAKEHSEDPGSALKGGELGWNDPEIYVPEFKNALHELEVDEIGKAFRSTHGWHLVQVIGKRVGDATEKARKDKAYQLLFNRKFTEEADNWMREMRDQAYIEVIEE